MIIYYTITICTLFLDQLLKYIVPKNSIFLLGDIARIAYTENTGAAFGILRDQRLFLITIGLIVIAIVLYFWNKIPPDEYLLYIAFSFILGGSISNLLDRIFRGFVVDFIDLQVWPVFNFADIMINLGVALIAVRIFVYSKEKETLD